MDGFHDKVSLSVKLWNRIQLLTPPSVSIHELFHPGGLQRNHHSLLQKSEPSHKQWLLVDRPGIAIGFHWFPFYLSLLTVPETDGELSLHHVPQPEDSGEIAGILYLVETIDSKMVALLREDSHL
jgi:hypothetical protein